MSEQAKIDLDEIERIAKRRAAARQLRAPDPEWFEATGAYLDATAEPVVLALITRIRELEAAVAAQQLVVDAADNLTRVKREAEKVFRTGLAGMPELVRTDPLAKGLARATADAGKKLERVLDAHRKGQP